MSDLCTPLPSPLRVVSVAHSAVGQKGGRQRYAPLLRQSDLDLHLVTPENWREFGRSLVGEAAVDPAMQLHILPILFPSAGPLNWYLHFYPRLPRLLRKVRPHVLHLWEEPWSIVALQAALTKQDAALVLEVDQNILKTLPPPFETIRRFVLRKCAHILARSQDAEAVVRACGYEGPVTMIGYGVDQECFRPDGPAAPQGAGLRIGYVGRLVEEKGLDDVLDALAQTRSMVSLGLIGAGPHGSKLRARVERLRLGDRVSFRDWAAPQEVAQFMRGLDALVLLTRTTPHVREQFGRVIIEAQACGVPVIGSSCGAIPDVVGEGGWIIPEHDSAALARLLDTIAAGSEDTPAKSRAALENVASRFTYDEVARRLRRAWFEAYRASVTAQASARKPYKSHPAVEP
ncbi:glycosyltransferase [Methylosinus sporium]|uniref:glycosyltransferase n=1 Tax=Methylosinus sporium TaxID=428 RepID=UPI000D593134|nr:glycosyltransferase [Methylosinus sporium]PWB88661.1 glycosyltransferase family 4 protein [Methylocystis sp. MitZ-2018]